MALVVESGSGADPTANTYTDAAAARAYALARGVTLPVDDAAVEAQLLRGMDYLEAQRARYQGTKTQPGVQPLQWPRIDVQIDGADFPSDAIPRELIAAQSQLCIEQQNGATLMQGSDGRVVVREKVDVLEVQYASPDQFAATGVGGTPSYPAVDALLAPLFGSRAVGIRTVRA